MKLNLIVNGAVYSSQTAYSAYCFAKQAVVKHQVTQVFFYQDGVTQANSLSSPLADEFDAVQAWAELAEQYNIDLVVCISAAERRGVIDDEQREEFAKPAANLHAKFRIQGLGAMHDATLSADRTVSFA